jgi:hypothetical protein
MIVLAIATIWRRWRERCFTQSVILFAISPLRQILLATMTMFICKRKSQTGGLALKRLSLFRSDGNRILLFVQW